VLRRKLCWAVVVVVIASLGSASAIAAHTRVDPTTLTPPLKASRVCYEDGVWIKCDVDTVTITTNEPAGELSCGQIYLSMTESSHGTRWYDLDRLLVDRNVTYGMRGTWSLSPDGAGPSVDIAADFSWHEHFPIPGDLSSDVEVSHGNYVRVVGLGAIGLASGTFKADGSFRGFDGEDPPEKDSILCALLVA
jgi:hypothetical protein